MYMLTRREWVWTMVGASLKGSDPAKTRASVNFLKPVGKSRTFTSIREGRAAKPGDIIWVRDLTVVAPPATWSETQVRGKWHARPYQLADGQSGRLLMVNDTAKSEGPKAVPPEFEVKLDLPGWYSIWIGVPRMDLRPRVIGSDGVDVALDREPGFVQIGVERGARKGRIMGPMNVEVMCYWKCVRLEGRSLRVRVPYGTFVSFPWGLVRGGLCSLRLVRLSDGQAASYQKDISDPATKRVIVVNDGFSHYFAAAEPGKEIDARYVQMYRDSDVKMLFFQTPATGVASWPSKVTNLLGEGLTEEQWKLRRLGDRRAYDYIQWAVKNGQEGFRVMSHLCREAGLEFHASLRMNLFFKSGGKFGGALEEYFNGRWWRDHPELRQLGEQADSAHALPAGTKLDYAHPQARQFVIDLLVELAANYNLDGINLDFTRWPPVADPRGHDVSLLTLFIKEIRQSLNKIATKKGQKLALSASVVEGYHAGMSLIEQKIDLEAWLASGALEFVCVQAWEQAKYLALARKYRTPYYAIQDQDSFKTPGGYRDDPEWQQEDRPDEDPLPGEELQEEPHLNNYLDPVEYEQGFLDRYRLGVDGVVLVNGGGNFARRLGHVEEMAQRARVGQLWGHEIGPGLTVFD